MLGGERLSPHPGKPHPLPLAAQSALTSKLTYFCMLRYRIRRGRWSCKGDLDAPEFGRRAAVWAEPNAQVSWPAGTAAGATSPWPQTRVCTACKLPPCRAPDRSSSLLQDYRWSSAVVFRSAVARATASTAGLRAQPEPRQRPDRMGAATADLPACGWRTQVLQTGEQTVRRDRCARTCSADVASARTGSVCLSRFRGSVRAVFRAVAGVLGVRAIAAAIAAVSPLRSCAPVPGPVPVPVPVPCVRGRQVRFRSRSAALYRGYGAATWTWAFIHVISVYRIPRIQDARSPLGPHTDPPRATGVALAVCARIFL